MKYLNTVIEHVTFSLKLAYNNDIIWHSKKTVFCKL